RFHLLPTRGSLGRPRGTPRRRGASGRARDRTRGGDRVSDAPEPPATREPRPSPGARPRAGDRLRYEGNNRTALREGDARGRRGRPIDGSLRVPPESTE